MMAEELVELGRKKRLTVSVGPVVTLTGVRCLSVGRVLARTECGLAYAARGIQNGKGADLQMGLNTVRTGVQQVSQMMPQGAGLSRRILSAVNQMDREVRRGRISKASATKMIKTLQELKLDVDRLFATGARACPGGTKK
jgi:hypothetical protein